MTAGHIFLSYKREEYDFALALATRLKNAGVSVWMDKLEIRTSDNWSQSIKDALNACVGLIAVLSPEYFTSNYCPNELIRAYNMQRPIFPVLYRKVDLQQMPVELATTQYVDFSGQEDPNASPERFDELIAAIKAKAPEQVGAIPDLTIQYVNTLVEELERRAGVLQYVELEGTWLKSSERPNPHQDDGWESEFMMLVNREDELDPNAKRVVTTDISEAVKVNPLFVLTGEPGTGKTTTIRRLASDAAKTRIDNPIAPLPLFVYLPQWIDESTPLDFLRAHWPFERDLNTALIKGDVLLYMDGLNEMGEDGFAKARKLREWLHSNQKPKHAVITCRTADYVGALFLGDDVAEVNCQPLTDSRIRTFVNNYLAQEQSEHFLDELFPSPKPDRQPMSTAPSKSDNEASNRRRLIELARNPYLLATLIYVFKHDPKSALPQNTGELFKGLARTLWEREKKRNTAGWIVFPEMEKAFARLAYAIIEKNMPVDVEMRWALLRLANLPAFYPLRIAEKHHHLLNAGRAASLIDLRGEPARVRFYHQLMQEYFAAEEALRYGVTKLMQPPVVSQNRRVAQKWDQVIIAACGIAPDPDTIVLAIAEKDFYLAAECIGSGIKVRPETVQKIVGRELKEDVERVYIGQRAIGQIRRGADDYDEIIVREEERKKRETGTWRYEPTGGKPEPKPVAPPTTSTPKPPEKPKEEAREDEDDTKKIVPPNELDDPIVTPPKPIVSVREELSETPGRLHTEDERKPPSSKSEGDYSVLIPDENTEFSESAGESLVSPEPAEPLIHLVYDRLVSADIVGFTRDFLRAAQIDNVITSEERTLVTVEEAATVAIVVLFVGPETLQNPTLRQEIVQYEQLNKPIILVLQEGFDKADFTRYPEAYRLQYLQPVYIEGRNGRFTMQSLQELLSRIRKAAKSN